MVFYWIAAVVVLGVAYAVLYRTVPMSSEQKLYLGTLFTFGLLVFMNVTSAMDEAAYWSVSGRWFTVAGATWVWLLLLVPALLGIAWAVFKPAVMSRLKFVLCAAAFLVGYVVMMLDFLVKIANAR